MPISKQMLKAVSGMENKPRHLRYSNGQQSYGFLFSQHHPEWVGWPHLERLATAGLDLRSDEVFREMEPMVYEWWERRLTEFDVDRVPSPMQYQYACLAKTDLQMAVRALQVVCTEIDPELKNHEWFSINGVFDEETALALASVFLVEPPEQQLRYAVAAMEQCIELDHPPLHALRALRQAQRLGLD